ncbi:hypothetical protein lbkm_4189 [Lachnospiraceae bacterium KM106-2]|nr:hypothetical protein lbkm_4189 [Lachnospiraceae bacterium KM106-2]
MDNNLAKLFEEPNYEEIKDIETYEDYAAKKMTKKEFVKEMLRLQEERNLYPDSEM